MQEGQIVKIHSDFYYVEIDDNIVECKLKDTIKKQQRKAWVGDSVVVENGFITDINQRKNFIPRPSVANIDQIVIVTALEEPSLDFRQLDRYIALAEYYNIDIKLCFNKDDLKKDDEVVKKIRSIYEPLNYDVLFTSALEHIGIDEFKNIMKNKISALCGSSGVGKSSLVNSINPDLNLRTKSISEKTGRGTHTTRHSEIIKADDTIKIIDTPGFSNLKFDFLLPWEVARLFREMKPYLTGCRFQNCLHITETGCNVKENLDKISQSRYESYCDFVEEAKEYKDLITYNGRKKETFEKKNNDKSAVKISSRKRQSSRRTMKQNLYKEEETE